MSLVNLQAAGCVGALIEVLSQGGHENLIVSFEQQQLLKVAGRQWGPPAAKDVAGGAEEPLCCRGAGQGGVMSNPALFLTNTNYLR